MRFTALLKFTAAAAAVGLTALPFALCLVFRGIEAWKLWQEMSRFTVVGIIAWLWAAVFLAGAVVTIFHLGTRRDLRRWEFLIDAANTVTSALVALECADQHVNVLHALPYGWQAGFLFVVFLIPQLTVTLAVRQARDVARRLRRRSTPPPADAVLFIQIRAPRPSMPGPSTCQVPTTEQTEEDVHH